MRIKLDTKIAFLLTAALLRGIFFCMAKSEEELNLLSPNYQNLYFAHLTP
jgi:hypothetical protein